MTALAPLGEAFSAVFGGLAPVFDGIWTAIKRFGNGFPNCSRRLKLLMRHYRPVRLPVKYLVKLLVSLSVPCLPRLNLSPGIGWILEKLGMAPKAAEDAVNKINKMKPVELSAEDAAKLKGRAKK